MPLSINYLDNGFLFSIQGNPNYTFPLDQNAQRDTSPEDWERLNAAEQIWYDGLLEFQRDTQSYFLPTQSYFLLDSETKNTLCLPPETAQLRISERGHIGLHSHQFFWDVMINSRPGGRSTRKGNIVTCAGHTFCLTEPQYQLIEWIETPPDSNTL